MLQLYTYIAWLSNEKLCKHRSIIVHYDETFIVNMGADDESVVVLQSITELCYLHVVNLIHNTIDI